MQSLEAYFTGLGTNDIRLAGHRIGIDDVLSLYVQGSTAKDIQAQFPTLRLEEIYATLTYYHAHQITIDEYLQQVNIWREERQQYAETHPSPLAQLIQARKTQWDEAHH